MEGGRGTGRGRKEGKKEWKEEGREEGRNEGGNGGRTTKAQTDDRKTRWMQGRRGRRQEATKRTDQEINEGRHDGAGNWEEVRERGREGWREDGRNEGGREQAR